MENKSFEYSDLHQVHTQPYSATLTGNPFLYQETKKVAGLMLQGRSLVEIREEVVDNNLFGYRSDKSVVKRVNAVHRRLLAVPQPVLTEITRGSVQEGKLLLILVLAVKDRVFREFMAEIVAPRYLFPEEAVSDSDFRRFFERKAELDSNVASWTEPVKTKLKTVITAALVEAGLVHNRENRKIIKPILTPDIHSIIKEWVGAEYLQLLVGK